MTTSIGLSSGHPAEAGPQAIHPNAATSATILPRMTFPLFLLFDGRDWQGDRRLTRMAL
jgi:hypothetical protein